MSSKPKSNLLKNINSNYILIQIFSFLEKGQELTVISYNKSLQKKLEVTIEDFKNVSGSYIITKRDDIGWEEHDWIFTQETNHAIFKGKIINGLKEGRGIEFYYNKRKKFEGKYHKGIKTDGIGYDNLGNMIYEIKDNKVIEIYNNGNFVFKGNYRNGKKWDGIGYDINGNKVYEIKYGKGLVKEYYDDGVLKFIGEYYNGERNGKGKKYNYEQEIKFDGEYKKGEKWKGYGKEYYTDQDDRNDVDPPFFNFDNLFSKPKKKKKTGFLGNLKPTPFEIFDMFGKEEKEEDPFMKKLMLDMFKNNNLERITDNIFGLKTEKKVLKYEGEYFKGKRHGKGKEFNKYGKLIYEGEYANGKRDGKGKQYEDEGMFGIENEPKLLYEGEFKNGKWNGKGKKYRIYLESQSLEYEGNFIDGKFVG